MARDYVSMAHLGPDARKQATKQILADAAKRIAPVEAKKPSKYRNIRVTIDGIKFDSKREGNRYEELKILQRAGQINDLECHPRYSMDVNGVHIGFYSPDFVYGIPGKGRVCEDVKSKPTMTTSSKLRIRLFEAIYNRKVVIIT